MAVNFTKAPKSNSNVPAEDDIPFDVEPSEVDVEVTPAPPEKSIVEVIAEPVQAQASPVVESNPGNYGRLAYRGVEAFSTFETATKEPASRGLPWRLRLKVDEERRVTFLDGDLHETTGFFDVDVVWEHVVPFAGGYPTYLCTDRFADEQARESCPICASDPNNKPYLVGFFTVIDHTPFVTKQGKEIPHQVRVFAVKRRALTKLWEVAKKVGGLAGARLDIKRLDGEANSGENFHFVKKFPVDALCQKYGAQVFDYSTVTNWCTAAELRGLGIGGTPVGAEVAGDEIDIDDL